MFCFEQKTYAFIYSYFYHINFNFHTNFLKIIPFLAKTMNLEDSEIDKLNSIKNRFSNKITKFDYYIL